MAVAGDEQEEVLDYMVKIQGGKVSRELYNSIVGKKKHCTKNGFTFVSDYQMVKKGSSIHEFTLKYIRETKKELVIQMAYFGNRQYIEEISKLVNSGKKVTIIAPGKSDVNFDVNIRVLKKLKKKIKPDLFRIIMYNGQIHAKLFIRDSESVFVGSHNMSMFSGGTIGEANVLVSSESVTAEFMSRVQYLLEDGYDKTLEIEYIEYSRLLFAIQRFAIFLFTTSFYLRRKVIIFNKDRAVSKYRFFYS